MMDADRIIPTTEEVYQAAALISLHGIAGGLSLYAQLQPAIVEKKEALIRHFGTSEGRGLVAALQAELAAALQVKLHLMADDALDVYREILVPPASVSNGDDDDDDDGYSGVSSQRQAVAKDILDRVLPRRARRENVNLNIPVGRRVPTPAEIADRTGREPLDMADRIVEGVITEYSEEEEEQSIDN